MKWIDDTALDNDSYTDHVLLKNTEREVFQGTPKECREWLASNNQPDKYMVDVEGFELLMTTPQYLQWLTKGL
jgi:hypothetical protein